MKNQFWSRFFVLLLLSLAVICLPILVTQAQEDVIHTVENGETLASIANQYGVTVEDLAAVNGLTTSTLVFSGEQLLVPLSGSTSGGSRGSTSGGAAAIETVAPIVTRTPGPTPTPTPLPSSNAIIVLPEARFTLGMNEFMPIIAWINFDPSYHQFWKVDIKASSSRAEIGSDRTISVAGGVDWVTVESGTGSRNNEQIAVIPGFPTLTEGRWDVRLVLVNYAGGFDAIDTRQFTVRVENFDPTDRAIMQPAEGQILNPGDPVTGTVLLNQFLGGYRIEILGGRYTTWTSLTTVTNDTGNPTRIQNGILASIPADLPNGQYRLRLVVTGLDSQFYGEAIERTFAVGDDTVVTFGVINIPSVINVSAGENVPLIGSVAMPQGSEYFKVEIRDPYQSRGFLEGQQPRFFDWTTLGDIQSSSVEEGQLVVLSGAGISRGNYVLRVVIVNPDGTFAAEEISELRIR